MQNFFSRDDLNSEIKNSFGEEEDIDENDFEEIKMGGVPERPNFPSTVFIFAVLLDFSKIISLGTLGLIITPLGWLLVRIYLIGKFNFMKRYIWRKALAHSIKNIMPIISLFLGSWSYFILRAHSKNYERIDKIISAIEKLISKKHL